MILQVYCKHIQAKKAAQKQRVSLWAEQKSNATGNSIAQTQASDSFSTLEQGGNNEENEQDQVVDIVELQEQTGVAEDRNGETISIKINYLKVKMLNVKMQMVQAIAKYKISSMKSIKLKQAIGSRLSQIQDSYKYNSQNQGIGGNENTQDQYRLQ